MPPIDGREWYRRYFAIPENRERKRAHDRAKTATARERRIAQLTTEGRRCNQCGELIPLEKLIRYSGVKYCGRVCQQRRAYLNWLASRGEQPRQDPRPQAKVQPPRRMPDLTEDERFERRWKQMQQEGRVWQSN